MIRKSINRREIIAAMGDVCYDPTYGIKEGSEDLGIFQDRNNQWHEYAISGITSDGLTTLAENDRLIELRLDEMKTNLWFSYSFREHEKNLHAMIFLPNVNVFKYTGMIFDESETILRKSITDKVKPRLEFPVPDNIEPMLRDLLSDTGENILRVFTSVLPNIRSRENFEKVLTGLGDLQLVFGLAKKPYAFDTLNYEIYDEIQNKLMKLIVAFQESDNNEIENLINDLSETFETIVNTNKELGNNDMPLITLQDTGRRIGGLRIFTPNES